MKVLIVGSGGREDALAWKISQSPMLTKLYCAPGNAGMAQRAQCVDLKAEDTAGLLEFAARESIDLTVVGPEAPLTKGLTDEFRKAGLRVFGPSLSAARLEGSKAFAKTQMTKFNIPTAPYEIFSNANEANHYAIEAEVPIVIKADGLASGKGVVVCETSQEAVTAVNQMMGKKVFGEAGAKVVIENKLEGEELSVLVLTDGEKIIPLASSQDHKRAFDHDRGPNTGGMGAYSPCPLVSDERLKEIIDLAIRPMIEGMKKEGNSYRGCLYAGLMLTKDGPFVLEYNCRFGDPETQVILPRLKSDLLPVLFEIADGRLKTERLEWSEKSCLGVVIASGGYPGHYETGFPISGLDVLSRQSEAFVFHAGTAMGAHQEWLSAGGRVLLVAALGDTLRAAVEKAYGFVGQVHFKNSFHRRDIGRKALEVLR
ncbi:MAG: phosphoribosylamine--glycine ligase [Candidatus Omnitrophota bacterium]|jgi:phosphoribosylamine--glycine ligase